jgi:hypothetical protein
MRSPRSPRFAPSASARSASARLRTSAPPRRLGLRALAALGVLAIAVAAAGCGGGGSDDEGTSAAQASADSFDADAAFKLIQQQVAVGQRPAGSPQLRALSEKLRRMLPDGRFEQVPGGLRNVVGTLPGTRPSIVVGAHYDTEYHPKGFVGANDGAAGTAAVIELARSLERELPEQHREIDFVLFDGEEDPPGCSDAHFEQCALRGSKAYTKEHQDEVGEMILLDYIANEGLRIPREANSDRKLWDQLRAAAAETGHEDVFPPEGQGPQFAVIDDHIPFVEEGVPAIDLIDFSYRYADSLQDTPDKLDVAALDAVGETVNALVLSASTG